MMNGGFGGISRQVETRHTDETTELRLPLQQGFWLAVVLIIALTTLALDVLVIGPLVGVAAVLAILVYAVARITVVFGRWAGLVSAIPGVLWCLYGGRVIDKVWPPIEVGAPLWLIFAVLAYSIPVYFACALVSYRMAYEIVDPNWPPTLTPRRPELGVTWPRARLQLMPAQVREVPRPVIINGNRNKLEAGPDVVAGIAESVGPTVMSPVGVEVIVNDVVQYLRKGPKIGTSSRVWEEEADWDWDYWNGVVRLLEQLCILGRIESRKKPKFIIEDFDEMMRRVSLAASE
jgi:hypothetical protein